MKSQNKNSQEADAHREGWLESKSKEKNGSSIWRDLLELNDFTDSSNREVL